jgi:lysozyme
MNRLISLAFILLLAACGGARTPAPSAVLAPPLPPRFGDADPTDWPGRGPAAFAVHGIDASKFQGTVDWQAARAAGVNFAFIKATEGGDRQDERFEEFWNGAANAGIQRGAYHFYYFCTSPQVQARNFIDTVPRQPGSLPPVLDLEWNPFSPTCTYRPPAEEVRAQVRVFMRILERHYGQRPIIYTTPDFWERNDIGALGEEYWLRAVARPPAQVYPGARWTFWQYSGTGRVPGFTGNTDLNAFAGSGSEWLAWLERRRIR